MSRGRAALAGPALLGLCACADPAPPAAAGPFRFVDVTREAGLSRFRQVNGTPEKLLISETFGAGVALFDFDRDGDVDAYLTNGSAHEGFPAGEEPRDALYENDGAGRFVDRTAELGLGDAGWTTGVRTGDVDDDGWSDLYLSNHGPNVLLSNESGRRFTDVTAEAGVGDPSWSTGTAFLDADRDGDLDLYVANYLVFDHERMVREERYQEYRGVRVLFGPHGLPPSADRFYRNVGAARFEDATGEVGVGAPARYGFQVVVLDYDLDGWLDLYVANDSEPNLLWHNEEGRTFVDRALRQGLALSAGGEKQAGMGIALGDYDGDLQPDVFVTNFADDYFTLYRNLGDTFFGDVTVRTGLSSLTSPLLGWGTGFHDLDADGDLDLYAVNGHVYPQVDVLPFGLSYRQPTLLLENDGGRLSPVTDGGEALTVRCSARGSAVGDVDGDGDLDLLIGDIDGPPRLLANEGRVGRSVAVLLVGSAGSPDAADVIGARAVGVAGGRRMLRLVGSGQGFLSSDDPRLSFGIGDAAGLDELSVTWPDGSVDVWRDLAAGPAVHVLARRGGR